MAETAGLISYFKLSNIIFGKVVVLCFAMNIETTDSSKEVINANSILVNIAGLINGKTILRSAVK